MAIDASVQQNGMKRFCIFAAYDPTKTFRHFPPLTGDAQKRSRCVQIFLQTTLSLFLEKNLNASRPSEQPPVREKSVITFRWDSGVPA